MTRAMIRSGPHTLVAKTIAELYPKYRKVIHYEYTSEAVIPETHRGALVAWPRSLAGKR